MQSAFMQKLPDFIEYESKTTQNENIVNGECNFVSSNYLVFV